jgi:DNA-binding NarL/FixJ family response regulator
MENKKVCIVDDSQVIRDRLTARLETLEGIGSIKQAADVSSAYTALRTEIPDIVILDIQLPDGSGIDVLSKIKKENSHIIVIMLTNYPYSIIRRRCFELGADYFFDKSTEFDQVLKVFETLKQETIN